MSPTTLTAVAGVAADRPALAPGGSRRPDADLQRRRDQRIAAAAQASWLIAALR